MEFCLPSGREAHCLADDLPHGKPRLYAPADFSSTTSASWQCILPYPENAPPISNSATITEGGMAKML